MMKDCILVIVFYLMMTISNASSAREINVKYRNSPVDVSQNFIEVDLKHSSLVKEIFYDTNNSYLLVRLKKTFYHYCGISQQQVSNWSKADSVGRFYLKYIKGNYSCIGQNIPNY